MNISTGLQSNTSTKRRVAPLFMGEFDTAGKTLASWSSDTVSIDIVHWQLVYAYTCKVFERKHVQEGLGVFAIVFEVPGKPAQKLDGYAVDLIDADRDPNTELKISDTQVSDEWALAEAKRKFHLSWLRGLTKPCS